MTTKTFALLSCESVPSFMAVMSFLGAGPRDSTSSLLSKAANTKSVPGDHLPLSFLVETNSLPPSTGPHRQLHMTFLKIAINHSRETEMGE